MLYLNLLFVSFFLLFFSTLCQFFDFLNSTKISLSLTSYSLGIGCSCFVALHVLDVLNILFAGINVFWRKDLNYHHIIFSATCKLELEFWTWTYNCFDWNELWALSVSVPVCKRKSNEIHSLHHLTHFLNGCIQSYPKIHNYPDRSKTQDCMSCGRVSCVSFKQKNELT